jgi:hypothetical protein
MLLGIEKTKKCLFPAPWSRTIGTAFTAAHALMGLFRGTYRPCWDLLLDLSGGTVQQGDDRCYGAIVADADVFCICVVVCVAGSASAIEKINLLPQRQPTFKLPTKIPEFTFARSIDNMVNK